jgi:hypothetical protein
VWQVWRRVIARRRAGGNYDTGSVNSNKIVKMTAFFILSLRRKSNGCEPSNYSCKHSSCMDPEITTFAASPEPSLRGRPGEQLAIFVIPVVEKAWATFSEPSRTYRMFECATFAIDRPRSLIQDSEKAKPAAA